MCPCQWQAYNFPCSASLRWQHLFFYHLSPRPQLSHQCQCTVRSRLGITVVCTHVSFGMPILGDSHVTLVPHPLLHLITLADGKAKGFEAGGRDGKNKCQMDISACRKGQKTLRPSATRAHEAGTSCAYSLCAGCINWYQFRSQRRACASIPDGHPEMWFPSKRRLVFTECVCLAEISLCVEDLSILLLTSPGTHLCALTQDQVLIRLNHSGG